MNLDSPRSQLNMAAQAKMASKREATDESKKRMERGKRQGEREELAAQAEMASKREDVLRTSSSTS